MSERHPYRIYGNVSAREYGLLRAICRDYGFKSIYSLVNALVRALLKYANTADYDDGPDSLGKEIEDMFDEMLDTADAGRHLATEHYRNKRR